MNSMHTTDTWSYKLFEQYLNTFFRELKIDLYDYLDCEIGSLPQRNTIEAKLPLNFSYTFKSSQQRISGELLHFSEVGFHRYARHFLLSDQHNQQTEYLTDPKRLAGLICEELAFLFQHKKINENLYTEIENSIENTKFFYKNRSYDQSPISPSQHFKTAEQCLIFGHPFHATSKSNIGFTRDDMKKYSPELEAVFQLHYFAVHSSLAHILKSQADFNIPFEREIIETAENVLKDHAEQYVLFPTHPWQASFLLKHPELESYITQQKIVYLGALGQDVWPTSSVRTVWLPETGLFLKLSIDVRITSFIRHNPLDEIERAIDASKIIIQQKINANDDCLSFLPELEARTVKIPKLENSFGVIYRAGLSSSELENTRMLAGLVEENELYQLPILDFIDQAFHSSSPSHQDLKTFILDWWERYINVALLPLLKLFSEQGISVEAHLQNSLMEFKNGYPSRLIIRDMEGISVVQEMFSQHQSTKSLAIDVSEDSTVWFSKQDAWTFLKYYLVINHISHILSSIARATEINEYSLWQRTRTTLLKANVSDQTAYYIDQLVNTKTIPIKANMLNTLFHTGGNPIWVNVPNPLFKYRGENMLTPLQKTTHHIDAEARVMGQLLEALIFEKALQYQLQDGRLSFSTGTQISYTCNAYQHFSFKRIKLDALSLKRHDISTAQTSVVHLKQLLLDLRNVIEADPAKWQNFCDELYLSYVKHDQTLQTSPIHALRTLPYFEQEARITNAHLYHPSFKSRIGFDLIENKQYAPELSTGFKVQWIAVHEQLCKVVLSQNLNLTQLYQQHFSTHDLQQIKDELAQQQLDIHQYLLFPVHPWQWDKIISLYYHDAIQLQQIVPLSAEGPSYLPQQSIRTLSNITDISAFSLKLSMNLINTSTSRVLAPHTVQNAAKMSDWLYQIVDQDQYLHTEHKPIILREIAGISVNQQIQLPVQYGALACIWRESIYSYLQDGEAATPVTGLMQLDIDGKPLIDDWIKQYGIETWLEHLFNYTYLPIMHILWCHGLALESHAQNMVLVHKNGLPVRVALKDFHDGIRFSRHLLRDPEQLPSLQDAPAEHAKINPNSFLETHSANELRDFTQDALWFVNLAELAIFLNQQYHFDEVKFWKMLRTVIDEHKDRYPEFAERYELFNFTDETIDIEQLASRRFLPEIRLRVQTCRNPLSFIQELEYE
ncbi:IucA/IucC family protein [Acinetobacter stercoris]|uniref:Aerobactin synthase n=1 Tax=Acinetobacter stercoris TaxID=2126983 RepID=A0A2U3MZA4_9GAMM|nr:IucA/IucC family protein [Acinetobacter stercoris]SPL70715.1 Aerobactin synthase [Acinetobacter stercoris]